MSDKENICFITFIGIPGSGKSSFNKLLEDYLKKHFQSELGVVQIYSVCYDDHFNVKNPNLSNNGSKWKEERIQILKSVENIVLSIRTGNYHSNVENENVNKPDSILIIIDDNMYYRSMRYEYYKLAKSLGLSFCQIYFDVSLEDALKYNRSRPLNEQVSDNIVKAMYKKIESPLHTNLWEKYSVTISSSDDYSNVKILDRVIGCIKLSLSNPVKSIEVSPSLAKEESRKVTNSSALHQIDNVLKQLVGLIIKEEIKISNKKNLGEYYSNVRLQLLRQIKQGEVILPIDLNKPIDQTEIIKLKPILADLLKNNLNSL